MGTIVVHALGAAEITVGDLRIKPTAAKKFAILLYLAAERGRRVPRAALQDLLFPELTEKNARHSLRELVYQLRQIGVPVEADTAGVGLSAEAVRSDWSEVIGAERLDASQVRAVEGGFLPGYAPGHSESYAEWFEGFRARVSFDVSKAVVREIQGARERGDWSRTEGLARACLALDPLNEAATLALAEMLALGGAKVQALDLLDRYKQESGSLGNIDLPAALLRHRISEDRVRHYGPSDFRFVGRAGEMSRLFSRLAAARQGRPQIVGLIGEPGIGKSRIANEAAALARLQGWSTLHARIQPGDHTRPMAAFAELAPAMMDLPGALGCSPESFGWLRRLVGAGTEEPVSPHHSYEDISTAISRAIGDLLDAVCAERPLFILIDDVQWVDTASVRLLRELASPDSSRELLFVVTGRNADRIADLALHNPAFTTIAVPPLANDVCRALVADRLSADEKELSEWIVTVARGNAFFLDCLVRHARETGERFVVPREVTEVVDHRLLSLSDGARHTLATIVRLGKRATISRLRSVLGMPLGAVLPLVSELERENLIHMSDGIEVNHWLIAESDERLTTSIASRMIHLGIADVLQGEATDAQAPGMLWDLSGHLVEAGEQARAAEAIAQCAHHALSIGRVRDAGELFFRAATLVEGDAKVAHLESGVRSATLANESDIVIRGYDLLTMARAPIAADVRLSALLARLSLETNTQDELANLHRFFRDRSISLQLRAKAARMFLVGCDQERAPILATEASADLTSLLEDPLLSEEISLCIRVVFHASFGNIDDVPPMARRLLDISVNCRPETAVNLARHAAIGFLRAGLADDAILAFERAYRDADSLGLTKMQQNIALMLAGATFDRGQPIDAERWYTMAKESVWGTHEDRTGFFCMAFETDRALALDDRQTMLDVAERARPYLHTHRSRRVETWFGALNLYCDHVRGVEIDPSKLIEATFLGQYPGFELGETSDFRVSIAAAVLAEQGMTAEAQEVVERYLGTYRRRGAPLCRALYLRAAPMKLLESAGLPRSY